MPLTFLVSSCKVRQSQWFFDRINNFERARLSRTENLFL